MRNRVHLMAVAGVLLSLGIVESHVCAQNAPTRGTQQTNLKEARVTHHAVGPFDVKLTSDPFADGSVDSTLGRMLVEKQFHGDLEGTSKGEMLTVATTLKGSGVYVAVERVTGTLQGRKGSFALHHTGIMTRGTPELKITVVPDSGTEELEGITGSLTIKIESGKHSYEFEYSLPEK